MAFAKSPSFGHFGFLFASWLLLWWRNCLNLTEKGLTFLQKSAMSVGGPSPALQVQKLNIVAQKMFQAPAKSRIWFELLSCSQGIQQSREVVLIALLDISSPLKHIAKSVCSELEASMCLV
jgi:hypothetical protein